MKRKNKKEKRDLKKAKVAIGQALVILVIFIIGTLIAFNYQYNPSFGSLESAVEHYSRGGEIDKEFEIDDNSYFVFIKKSRRDVGYFYEENNDWKFNQFIKERRYPLSEDVEASIYQVRGVEHSFIKVSSKNKINTISDNLGTDFVKIELKNQDNVFYGENVRKISKYYIIYVNNKEYKVTSKKYMNSLFQ